MNVTSDMRALVHNADVLKAAVGDFYCVLKCNAYGHGAVSCARTLYEAGMENYAVFSLKEALEIRPFVGSSEILILGRTDFKDLPYVFENNLTQTVFSEEYAALISAFSKKIKLHIKVDTGMNRSGFIPDSEKILSATSKLRDRIYGVYTHFPCADANSVTDTEKRLSVFTNVASELEILLKKPLTKHAAASAAAVRVPSARLDLSRIGLLLYGATPDNVTLPTLKPVMSLFGHITGVRRVKQGETVGYGCRFICKKDSYIATVDVGYASGLQRCLCGRFMPKLLGERVPIAAVCMDRSMLDVTSLFESGKAVKTGDTVIFFGDDPKVTEMADASDTISYEIFTSMNACGR